MESPYYRATLEDILEFSGGRRLLTFEDVRRYTGLKDPEAIKRRFPVVQGYICATAMAACLSAAPGGGRKKKS